MINHLASTVKAAQFLAQNNIPIISGIAKGIDGYEHTACLKSGGYTIAILGCGLDICYSKEHIELMQKIIEKGAVISEYPPGTQPDANHFLMRNRLISAWCKKLLVVEAGEEGPMSLSELLLQLQEHKSDILEIISIMELKGMIINVGGILREMRYKIYRISLVLLL